MHLPLYLIGAFGHRHMLYEQYVAGHILPPPYQVVASWLSDPREDADLDDMERLRIVLRNEQEIIHSFGCIYVPSSIPGFGREREIGMCMAMRRPILMLREKTAHPLDHHPMIHVCTEDTLVETLRRVIPYAHAI